MKTIQAAGALLLIATAPAATAQDVKTPTGLVDALAACLDIRDDAERLACSDRAGRALVDATRRKEIVVLDKAEVTKTRRSLFGFTLPKINLFGGRAGNEVADDIDELDAKIVRVVDIGQGKYSITIDSGARWTTVEPWLRGTSPAAGLTMSIRKAALGSYFVKIGNGRAVRAMRVG